MEPLKMRHESNRKIDFEYVRKGTCTIFALTQHLKKVRHASFREHRAANDWAQEIETMFDGWYPDEDTITPNRIVSISKPYVRPIVRGKEVKSVENCSSMPSMRVQG